MTQRGDFDAAAPDPSFRDQLVQRLQELGPVVRTTGEFVDALLPLIEARVQAAAKKRAAEELRKAADAESPEWKLHPRSAQRVRARAAALAQPGTEEET